MATANPSQGCVPSTFNIEQFDPSTSQWNRWLQRFEGALGVFKVTEGSKVAYLLHYIGAPSFDMLCDRLDPENPYEQSYEQITTLLQEFYEPTPLEIVENFRFHQRKQEDGETIQQFIAALHKLSVNCKMGAYLKTALRNQLVFGVSNKRIQSRLLEVKDLTFDKACQIATTMELSEKGGVQLQAKKSTGECLQVEKKKMLKPKGRPERKQQNMKPERKGQASAAAKTPNPLYKANASNIICYRCGDKHFASKCTLSKEITCHSCGKKGHLNKVCFSKKENVRAIEDVCTIEHFERRGKFEITLQVNHKPITFEVDSGAAVTLVSQKLAYALFPNSLIHHSNLRLVTFCKTEMRTCGFMTVTVVHCEKKFKLNMYLTEIDRPPILGREWIHKFLQNGINILKPTNSLHYISTKIISEVDLLKNTYERSIQSGKGITGLQAKFTLKDNAKPVFIKARPVPFKLRPLIEKEINSLVEAGILVKVTTSEWATPVVPVLKKNNTVRLCGDYSVTLNPNLVIDKHPVPTIEELFSSLAGGIKFSKIDLKDAYLQLKVHPDYQHLLTISTHMGLFKCTRLLYGNASAPGIWQREMEMILSDLEGVVVFFDDIRVTGSSDKEHLERLQKVIHRLLQYNILINWDKSDFFKDSIHYCGYIIDKNGIHKEPKKLEAIDKMPRPSEVSELRAFLGMINYYGRFIRNLSSILYPLNTLLRKNTKFIWGHAQEEAFITAKKEFKNENYLVHFNPKLPLILATDASSYGVGAVLSHRYPDGSERVILYASQSLSDTQKKYSQIDKEAYAIIFGVKKFYQYLYANEFTLITDHRPLVQIFNPARSLPICSALRMQHYALFLRAFNYKIQYRQSKAHGNADCLSRLPIPEKSNHGFDVADAFEVEVIESLPITMQELVKETDCDSDLQKIKNAILSGKILSKESRFNIEQHEFNVQAGILMRGHRVIIPKKLRSRILKEIHEGHFGIVKMKSLARSCVWWPGLDKDLEILTYNCRNCNALRNNPKEIEKHIWEPASFPFQRIHLDFAGPFLDHYFLILVDAYSKWPEVHLMHDITAKSTIQVCRKIFATFGIPQILVTDNGRTFTSTEFQNFLKSNNIKSKLTAPYHPATNGQAERFVQTMKNALRRMSTSKELVQLNLQKFLLQYRRTPHATTNKSPSELMFGRQIRSRLDFLKPLNLEKPNVNSDKIVTDLIIGQRVACRDYLSKQKWRFGRVKEKLGKLHYLIHLDDGRDWRRHINQIRKIGEATPNDEQEQIDTDCGPPPRVHEEGEVDENGETPVQEQEVEDVSQEQSFYDDAYDQPQERQEQEQEQILRRSERVHRKPNYLDDYYLP